MRAGTVLEALTKLYRVSLLIPTGTWHVRDHTTTADVVPHVLVDRCEEIAFVP